MTSLENDFAPRERLSALENFAVWDEILILLFPDCLLCKRTGTLPYDMCALSTLQVSTLTILNLKK